MKASMRPRGMLLVLVSTVLLGVLVLYRSDAATPNERREPFANSVQQRQEIIAQLKLLNRQLEVQNELLRSGKVHVTLQQPN